MAGAGLFFGVLGFVFYLFVLLLPIALLVALQVWLCRKNVKLGLILPGITLALSLVLSISLAVYSMASGTVTSGGVNYMAANGNEIAVSEPKMEENIEIAFAPRTLIAAGVVFLVANIPTVVFGGIWLHYKGRQDTYEDLKRMRIEDLE